MQHVIRAPINQLKTHIFLIYLSRKGPIKSQLSSSWLKIIQPLNEITSANNPQISSNLNEITSANKYIVFLYINMVNIVDSQKERGYFQLNKCERMKGLSDRRVQQVLGLRA